MAPSGRDDTETSRKWKRPGAILVPVKKFGLPRRMRIVRSREIRAVLDRRRSVANRTHVLYVRPNDHGHPRLVFLVGKKHGKAHRRYRIKRLLREAFRLSRADLPGDLDLAVIPRVTPEIPSLAETRRSLLSLARRASRNEKRGPTADRAD
jgi:ribonuclease P protein component